MHQRLRRSLILVLCLGFQAEAASEASNLRFRAIPDPNAGLAPIAFPDGADPLPVGWKFHPISPTGNYPTGQSNVAVTINTVYGTVNESYREGDVEVREPFVSTRDQYAEILSDRTVRKLWREKTRQTRSVARGQGRTGPMFRYEVPVQFPKLVRSIVGDGAPSIEVSGSETITFSGTSDWVSSSQIQTESRRQSVFPSLEMKQELNVNLTGSIGDKIKVDVDQSSNVVTSVDNKVKLRYEGDEDDMIRAVELGNTNLSVEGASFRQEGLFGIKTVAKLGTVDLVTIASKQEGKTETARFTPSGENKRVAVLDLDYIHRKYFLIADRPVKIRNLKVYKDIRSFIDPGNTAVGIGRLDPIQTPYDSSLSTSNPEFEGRFIPMTEGIDYFIERPWTIDGLPDFEIPVIRLQVALGTAEVLAVAYEDISGSSPVAVGTFDKESRAAEDAGRKKPAGTLLLKVIKPPSVEFLTDLNGVFDPTKPWYPALFYELRNFYDLTGRDIAAETLNIAIRRTQNGEVSDPEAVDGRPLIQILGLDQRSRGGAGNENVPDGKIDDNYFDPVTGILFFPDLHPFDPDTTNPLGLTCSPGFGGFNCLDNFGRNTLRRDSSNPIAQSNLNVYYTPTPERIADHRFYIDAEFKSSTQGFFLGRFDILENSEQVKVDNIPQKRGTDYTIDYSTGQVTFLKPPGPDQAITVDYSFAPGIGATQLTLLGASASYVPGPNLSITSSVIYDSRGALEQNPKLGEEPARSIVGDLASVVTFRPVWMTQMANLIPGVQTNSPSTLNIQGHAGVSVPNPNTAGEAYIDDMEGNRESNTVSLSRTAWFWSSPPLFDKGDSLNSVPPVEPTEHLRLQWYNPTGESNTAAEGHDLKPTLENEEGGDSKVTVLELNLKPAKDQTSIAPTNWTGLTQAVSTVGQDFSKLRFLEIWVNDFTPNHANTEAKLHIDFGRVSEDAFWHPDSVPNNRLDTEDENGDGRLDCSEELYEDTGLDGIPDALETGDPNLDNYGFQADVPDKKTPDYSRINNLEKNGCGEASARPDTEDLNRNTIEDFQNHYFEATIDLADTSFVAIDVPRDYFGNNNVKANNGWRLFRIPLDPDVFLRVGSPSWENVQHMRIWVNGVSLGTDSLRLQIGGIELVGNRWLAQALDPLDADRGLELAVASRNNKDDAGFYNSPYEVENTVGGTATRREQSLALRFSGVTYGDSVLAFKTTSADGGGLGWTPYRQIRFWVHGEPGSETRDLRVLARFGPDTVNYYEYSAPVRSGWQGVVIPMEYLSRIKESGGSERVRVDSLTSVQTREVYTVVGNPSFTRIQRISFGVTARDSIQQAGEVWINDLRLADVRRDRGMSGDLAVQANFADVVAMNLSYQNQDEDFIRVGAGNLGSGLNHVATNFSTTFQVDRIMPTSGVQLPVRFSVQHSSDVPKFRTGSDVILSGERSKLETREQNRQTIDFNYSRTGAQRGLARYTLNAIKGGMSYSRFGSVNPTSKDSSWTFNANSAYDIPIGGGGFGIGKRMKINLLPDVLGFTMAWQSSRNLSYGRKLLDEGDSTNLRSDVKVRHLTLGGNSSWTPVSSVRLRFGVTTQRNMLLHEEGLLGFNKGTEVDHQRRIELNYTPRWFSLLSPTLTMNGRYHRASRPELRVVASDPVGLKSIDNGGSARVTATVPIGRYAQRISRRGVLSRVQDVQTSFSFERGASISRVTGDPGFLFETGFTEARSPALRRLNNSTFTANRTYTSGANTTFRPASTITIDARADHRLAYLDATLTSRRNLSLSLPDLKGRWHDLQRLLGLQSTITTMSLNSGYNVRREESGPEDGAVEIRTTTTNWTPLLGWNVAWRNGLRADVTTTLVQATSVNQLLFGVIGERQEVRTDVNLTKVFPASRGIKFPWNKKPIKLPNDLNLNLRVALAANKKVTKRPGFADDLVEIDQQRLDVTSATNYNITQSISGGFNLGFRQAKDQKTAVTTRGITVALNAQFRF